MSAGADIFSPDGPRWFSIPSGRSFLDDLAEGLCTALTDELPTATILTPTRRGARAMARAFSQRARGGALLLPQIRAIGDLDEGEPPFDLENLGLDLPVAITPLRRRFELAKLVSEHYPEYGGHAIRTRRALDLADSLASFFDSLALEEIDAVDKLDDLVSDRDAEQYVLEGWAEHWQISARFLNVAVREWPKRLADLNLSDPSRRQVVLIRRLIDQWADHPPVTPLVLAGSTGSAPSTADLSHLVAGMPKGAVVLPGLDLSLPDAVWAQIEESHPQNTMKRLLDRHGVTRAQVHTWPASLEAGRRNAARRRLLNEALRPAEATKDWLQIDLLRPEARDTLEEGLTGLHEIETARDEEAASVIALLMREVIDTPDRVAALVTPDITLARRVAARLSRWGLQPDSSAGEPLSNTLAGRFLTDLFALIERPHDPVQLLGFFNNPLCRFADHKGLRKLEKDALRGATPNSADDITAILKGAHTPGPEAIALWADYLDAMAPVREGLPGDLGEAITLFVELAQGLATASDVLWTGAPGACASQLLSELIREGAGVAVADTRETGDILRYMMAQAKVRTGGNIHPRLLILGAIEARLVKADRLILAGLEEGVWPQAPEIDPFLSRPLREKLGLPPPERRTGLSAHDFVQAASAPEAYLITRHRREGEPQVASRWLWRLQTLCAGARVPIAKAETYLHWARALDCGLKTRPPSLKPATRPSPRPPVAARPATLPVTDIETWVRDPYAIYAKRILRLKPMDRANEPVEARQRGTAIHRSLERFASEEVLGDEGVRRLTNLLEDELVATHLSPAQMALQRPLLASMAQGVVTFETERRQARPRLHIEQAGALVLKTAAGEFTLTAKADRIEVREDGIDVLDFKTGNPPTADQVRKGFNPQLTLTAAMIERGAFEGIASNGGGRDIGDLLYVRVAPDKTTPKTAVAKGETAAGLAHAALDRLKHRIDTFSQVSKPYLSWVAPLKARTRGGDYDHLARLYEWDVLGDDDGGAADAEGEA